MEKMPNFWPSLSFVKISKNRKKIVKELITRPQFPSELAKILEIDFSTISRNLKLLEKRKIVQCHTPDLKKGKIYALSELGRYIVFKFSQEEETNK